MPLTLFHFAKIWSVVEAANPESFRRKLLDMALIGGMFC